MLPVRIHLLGKFQAIADAADVLPRGRKTRGLLAYMATAANGTVTRDRAADLLWSDRGAEQARGSLRQAIAELRAAAAILSQALSFSRDLLSFAPGSIIRDLDIIVEAIDKGDAAALDRALAHAGPFLEDLDGLSPAFDEWLQSERVRQLDRVMASCLDGLDAMIGQGRPATIQSILRSLDRLDPWNETVARIGLQVDHASNDMVSLHKRYRRLVGGLREEFGIDPSPETRSLFERLIASAPESSSTSRNSESGGETLPPMVLVSPMGTIGGDPDVVEMADIVTDDIRTALFNHRDLRVLALDSSDIERVERVCRDAVGAYMVSGRLRRVGGELRINLQIGEITSATIVWSEQLRVGMDDVAAAIDHVVARAAGALVPTIDHDLATRPKIARLDRGDAAARYAKARRLIGRGRDLAEVREGVALLEDLLAADRSHVGAALLLARLYNNDLWQRVAGHDVAHFRGRALELAHQASLVEPANARIKLRLAWCNLRQREWDHAEQGFREVVTAMTYDADGLNECAVGLALLGDLSEADELAQRAFALNPFAPTDYHADRGIFLMMQGDAAQAEEFFAVSGEQGPMYLAARLSNLAAQGVTDGAAFLALRDAFGGAIASAWQRHEPAGVADVLYWADGVLPIRTPERREAFRQGLARALGQDWTAMPHSAS